MNHNFQFDNQINKIQILKFLKKMESMLPLDKKKIVKLQHMFPKENCRVYSKAEIIFAYRKYAGTNGLQPLQEKVIKQLRLRPIRTLSGVAPVTVLTKPYPCPGKCIFCPSDIRMPKSYINMEPGAQRAEHNYFDPYLQTFNRIKALYNMGHNVAKIELIVLGGTWTSYPLPYQIWFIKECFRAMNEFDKKDDRELIIKQYLKAIKKRQKNNKFSLTADLDENKRKSIKYQTDLINRTKEYNNLVKELYLNEDNDKQKASWGDLEKEHLINEKAKCRCIGLVLETRPDQLNEKEVVQLRRFGATKIQLGVQSLDNNVLKLNKRNQTKKQTAKAFSLLRRAGFKIHAHWMANLYGSDVNKDKKDYKMLFHDDEFKPDELKIYPCSLIKSAELMDYYKKGLWKPYSYEELMDVVTYSLLNTPIYCRLTRVFRDIPSPDIVAGNKKTNFRQLANNYIKKIGKEVQDIRAREIRNSKFRVNEITIEKYFYETSVSQEVFIQFLAPAVSDKKKKKNESKKLLGFLRLSLPKQKSFVKELGKAAIIREIHVYGLALQLGSKNTERAQHLGLGKRLIETAKQISKEKGYDRLAVISAIGTKEYYRKLGFRNGRMYQSIELCD